MFRNSFNFKSIVTSAPFNHNTLPWLWYLAINRLIPIAVNI